MPANAKRSVWTEPNYDVITSFDRRDLLQRRLLLRFLGCQNVAELAKTFVRSEGGKKLAGEGEGVK